MNHSRKMVLIASILACSFVQAKPIVIAVIDTGIDSKMINHNSLCKSGHKDFTGTGLRDSHGHGTHISGIIDQYAKNYIFSFKESPSKIDSIRANYCQIIIKFYDPQDHSLDHISNITKSFKWAIKQKVDIINISGGGIGYSSEERAVVLEALNKGIKIVAAAGNEGANIDKNKYYPAMYDKRIFVVGNLVNSHSRNIAETSNYGKSVNTWEVGTRVFSRMPNKTFGFMTGTSQATAVKSGKLIREMLINK